MKKKSSLIAKSVMAATVAASVIAVANPASAASVSNAEKSVVKAEKLAGALKWETSLEYRKTKYPKSVVGYPNMKLHNDTKQALAEAKKAVSTLKGKEKVVLSARLDANVATYVNRSAAYIDAVSSGLTIQKKYNELHAKFVKGVVDDQTETLYHQLSYEIKKNAYMLDRVYGVTTRTEFREFYKRTAEKQLADLIYPVTIKMEIDRANASLKSGNVEDAAKQLGNAEFFVKEAAKKGLPENSKLIVSSLSKLKAAQADFSKQAVLYVAKSTSAAAPTTFGPATGSDSINKTVYVYVGLNEQLKLQNVSIDGNLVILGSPAGAGSVYLDNVKVNKVNSASGSIIVEDIADHSLHMKGVQAESVVVNDADGSNIIAEQGTKVKSLVVSDKAGAKGKTSLESTESGAIGAITIASKGSSTSQGVDLKGNLSETSVTVTGQNAKIALGQGTVVKELIFKASAQVSIPEGSTVKEVKKDSSVTGEVKVDNKGTIEKADSNVNVGGKKPGEVTTPPAGGGGGGVVVTSPTLNSFAAEISSGKVDGSYDSTTFGGTVSLVDRPDSDVFTGVQIETSNALKFKITSITAGTTAPISIPISLSGEYKITEPITTITTNELFGISGISLANLRGFIGNVITLKGNLIDSNGKAGNEITIKITLAVTSSTSASFTNDYGTITKNGTNIEVAVNPNKKDIPIAGTQFAERLLLFAGSNIDFNSDLLKSLIVNKVGKTWDKVTFGDLVSVGTLNKAGYTVIFKSV